MDTGISKQIFKLMSFHGIGDWNGDIYGQIDFYPSLYYSEWPKHPLEQRGFTSIGCEPCTRKIDLEMQVREARWFGLNKLECGLHTELISKK